MQTFLVLALGLAAVAAVPANPERIVGGQVTNIQRYPYTTPVLSRLHNFRQACGGTIINNRSVLSAAHCFQTNPPTDFRVRVGSTQANSGGVVHTINRVLNHPYYIRDTLDNDFSLLRTNNAIIRNNYVNFASIAGPNYNTGDNAVVWAVGWGAISWRGPGSESLREVQIWTVNLGICRQRYSRIRPITDNMLCSGWLDVGGRDQCQGDSGGPLVHNNVIVGVCSFGYQCALANYPGVNARVSRASVWIQNNA